MLVLTLDVGSSSVRCHLFDAGGRVVPDSGTHLPYAPSVGADGRLEVDPGRLERLVHLAVAGTLAHAGAQEVGAVGVSTFWHGLVGIDAGGAATTPVLLWADTRSAPQAERLRERLDAESVRLRTGSPIHPAYWPAKLAWLRETDPAAWSRTAHWVSFADLLYLHLFGELATSPSMASGTGLRRLDGGWDRELLDVLDVREEQLPPEATELRGLLPEARQDWPRLAGAIWLCAAGDGALANLGSGCTDIRQRALTVGTSGALRVMADAIPERLARGLWCYLLEPGSYVVGGSLSSGGNLYAWLMRTLRVDEAGLEARLQAMEPAATGLTFMPLLAGERSPGFATHATGAIAGLTLATTADDIVRAGLEAVALTFAGVDAALDDTVPGAERLVASGAGLLSSPAWVQMMADAIGKPVAVSRSAMEASSVGAAALALRRLGLQPRTGSTDQVGRNVEPRERAGARYAEARRRQGWLYTALIEGST
jgi:gluconokinase